MLLTDVGDLHLVKVFNIGDEVTVVDVEDGAKKSFGACHNDHRRWYTLADNRDAWMITVSPVIMSPPLKGQKVQEEP